MVTNLYIVYFTYFYLITGTLYWGSVTGEHVGRLPTCGYIRRLLTLGRFITRLLKEQNKGSKPKQTGDVREIDYICIVSTIFFLLFVNFMLP